jgi:hypothetical protein
VGGWKKGWLVVPTNIGEAPGRRGRGGEVLSLRGRKEMENTQKRRNWAK